MHVVDNQKNQLKKIVHREIIVPGTGYKGDEGTERVTLECGHTIENKRSQMKSRTSMRCKQCGITPSRPLQEHGPFRHRNWVDPQDQRLQRRLPRLNQGREESLG